MCHSCCGESDVAECLLSRQHAHYKYRLTMHAWCIHKITPTSKTTFADQNHIWTTVQQFRYNISDTNVDLAATHWQRNSGSAIMCGKFLTRNRWWMEGTFIATGVPSNQNIGRGMCVPSPPVPLGSTPILIRVAYTQPIKNSTKQNKTESKFVMSWS